MEPFDLVVRNARVATAADLFESDIGIAGGRVVALARDLPSGRREIDAAGRLVTPGGVDGHCHLDQPMPAPMHMADDFVSGTRSAACGGTTTVVPFAAQEKGQSLRAAVEDYHRRAEGKASIDYAFHLIVSDPTPQVLDEELPALIQEGYTSFKVYLTYDDLKLSDRQFLDVLALAGREQAMVMVHAENSDAIAWLTERLLAEGHTAPRYHADSRPAPVEREATHRAITFSELLDVPILIVHVSGADAIEQIRWGRARGLNVYAETCPQYLFLTADALESEGFSGAMGVCSPPPRDAANQQAVWDALRNGSIDMVASDHAPHTREEKEVGWTDAWAAHTGTPGIQDQLPLLLDAVHEGKLSLARCVDLTSAAPARIFNIDKKGSLAPGSDADIVLVDLGRPWTITNEAVESKIGWTPYHGRSGTGSVVRTLVRGTDVYANGEVTGLPGHGKQVTLR